MNNSPNRHCPNDRTPLLVVRLPIAAALVAVLCGCHYCPHNRYTPCRGYGYASDGLGRPYACNPGGRRESRYYGDSRCNQGGCLGDSECGDSDALSYYPEPQPVEETPELESPVQAPVVAPRQTQQAETSPLTPFAPTENFPPPPTASAEPSASGSASRNTRSSDDTLTPTPLFEGRLNVDESEPQPVEQLILPQAPTPSVPPAPPLVEENPIDAESASLFPLRFPPRLFRLRNEQVDTEVSTPPIAEASTSQGARIIGGHSHTVPARAANQRTGRNIDAPVTAPTSNVPAVGTGVTRFGHSL